MLKIIALLIVFCATTGLYYKPISGWFWLQNERCKACICKSFSVGLTKDEVIEKCGLPAGPATHVAHYEVWTYYFGPRHEGGVVRIFFATDMCIKSELYIGSGLQALRAD